MQPRWPPQCQEHTGWAPPGPWLGLGPLPEHAPRLRGRLLLLPKLIARTSPFQGDRPCRPAVRAPTVRWGLPFPSVP